MGSQYGDYFVFPIAGVDELPPPNPLQKCLVLGYGRFRQSASFSVNTQVFGRNRIGVSLFSKACLKKNRVWRVCPQTPIGEPVWGLLCLPHSWRGRVASQGIFRGSPSSDSMPPKPPANNVISVSVQSLCV